MSPLLRRRPVLTTLAVAAASAAATVVLGGCAVLSSFLPTSAPVRDATGTITEAEEHTDVFALRVGDCLAADGGPEPFGVDGAPEGEDVWEAPTVPCSEPHETEIYHAVQLGGEEFPGEDALGLRADDACYAAFTPFVGLEYEESYLDYTLIMPTAQSWSGGDREVLCLIGDPSSLVTGTLEDSGV